MNLQRTEIYGLRRRILKGEDLKDEILDQMSGHLENTIITLTEKGSNADSWDLPALYDELQTSFGIVYRVPDNALSSTSQEKLFDEVWKEIKQRYIEKEQRFGEPVMRQFERSVFLMVIDNLWKDHLYEMDHLKGGVQYRAFGQKNPLYEYQREGLKLFEELRNQIAKEVTSYIFKLERVEQQQDRMGLDVSRTIHSDFDVYSSSSDTQAGAGRSQSRAQQRQLITNRSETAVKTPVRVEKQVGRNEPCPCGSGKKYKKCCGANA